MIKKILELVINTEQAENALQRVDKGVQRIDKDTLEEVGAFKRNGRHAAQSIRVNLLKEGVYEFGGLLSEVSVSFTNNDERFK